MNQALINLAIVLAPVWIFGIAIVLGEILG
jgi:hypothetical protein